MAIKGPVTGGSHGWTFGGTVADLAHLGYIEEEYFFEGAAQTYRPLGELANDGFWSVQEGDSIPFETRLVVLRPTIEDRFSGTVFAMWANVSAGYDSFGFDTAETFESGHAVVYVSAQSVGVHGFNVPEPKGLTTWDLERYGSLSIPSDDASYDIFRQAVGLLGANRAQDPIDLLGGLEVRRVIATGGSQSAHALATYINAVAPLSGEGIDGYLLTAHFGGATPLVAKGDRRPSNLVEVWESWTPTALRTDLGVPIMVVQHGERSALDLCRATA